MPFIDRTPRRIDPYLEWKVRLFVLGAGLALISMLMEIGWLMAVAALLLGAGFSLRFLTSRHEAALRRAEQGEGEEGEEADDWGDGMDAEEDRAGR